jgi:hypothetical protein
MAAAKVDLRSDSVRGAVLAFAGLALLAIGASIPIPTGGGFEAVAAGFAILLGFASLLLGVILFLLATRV